MSVSCVIILSLFLQCFCCSIVCKLSCVHINDICSKLLKMFQRMYLKVLLGIVLLVLVIWTFSLFSSGGTHRIYLLHGEFYYSGKEMIPPPIKEIKQLSLPTEENRQNDDKKQPVLPSEIPKQDDTKQPASSMVETKQVDRKQITSPPPIRTKQIDKNQPRVPIQQTIKSRPTLPPKGAKVTDKPKQPATPPVNYTVMGDHDLLVTAFAHDQPFYGKYLQTLPASVIERLTALFGVGNLTTRHSQEQFLKCAGIATLRWLKTVPQELPVHLPSSRQQCKKMSFQASGPSAALVSYPGSGNSWIRQLLESATGIYTGAMYCDPSYLEAGMVGEGMDSLNVIATKLHFWPSAVRDYLKSRKVIYVVRSPFAAILSENNRNVARNTKDVKKVLESHVMEVNFKYGM